MTPLTLFLAKMLIGPFVFIQMARILDPLAVKAVHVGIALGWLPPLDR